MKKLVFTFLLSALFIASGAYLLNASCGTCTVSSNPKENSGKCKPCVGGDGDACVQVRYGVDCSGNSDNGNIE